MTELMFVVAVVTALVIVLICSWGLPSAPSDTEGYGSVLGQLAPYAEQMNQCLNECNRSDPNNRLTAQANINCGKYCESVIGEMANRGIPPSTYPIHNNMVECEKQCSAPGSTHNEQRKCISMCHGQREVAQWCKELWCPYSLWGEGDCMDQCIALWNTNNNNNSWTWDMER